MKTTQTKSTVLEDVSQTSLSDQELNKLFFLIKNTNNDSEQKYRADRIEQLKKQISDCTYPILNNDFEIRNKAAYSILSKMIALEEV